MSTLRTDGAGSNGVRSYREMLTDHLPFIDRMVQRPRLTVRGVPAEDVAAEIVLYLLAKERHFDARPDTVFERWVELAAKRVVSALIRTRGWASSDRKMVFRSLDIPRVVNASDVQLDFITDRPSDEPPALPACRQRVRQAILRLKPMYRRAVLVKHWLSPDNLREYDREAGNKVDETAHKLGRAHRQLRALLAG